MTIDQTALSIYVVMARDACDALEMIQECSDLVALALLYEMLGDLGNPSTDAELNKIFAGPVQRRLEALGGKS